MLNKNQGGFSLVELMIASVLGLVIISGAISIMLSTRQNTQYQDGFTSLQENSRVAGRLLTNTIRMAGFCNNPDSGERCLSLYVDRNQKVIEGRDGGEGREDRASWPDEVTVRFQADGETLDCLGNQPGVGQMITTRFFIQAVDGRGNEIDYSASPSAKYELRCSNGVTTETVVEGVENLQIHYGIDVDGDLIAERYVRANEISDDENATTWKDVVTVSMSFLVNSVDPATGTETAKEFDLEGTTIEVNDARLRLQYDLKIQLRNRAL